MLFPLQIAVIYKYIYSYIVYCIVAKYFMNARARLWLSDNVSQTTGLRHFWSDFGYIDEHIHEYLIHTGGRLNLP